MPAEARSPRTAVGRVARLLLLGWLVGAVVFAPPGAPTWQRVLLAVGVVGFAPWAAERIMAGWGRSPRYQRALVVGLVVAVMGGAGGAGSDVGPALTLMAFSMAAIVGRVTSTLRLLLPVGAAAVGALLVSFVAVGGATWTQTAVAVGSLALGAVIGALRRQSRQTAVARESSAVHRLAAAETRAENATLLERQRIAREIHDVLAHSLGGLAVQLDAAEALADAGRTDDVREAVRRAHVLAVDGLREARDAVAALRAPGGLGDRLVALAEAENLTGADVRVALPDRAPELPEPTSHALERVAREALTNARKHAHGARVAVRLVHVGREMELVVEDVGGVASPVASTGAGRGIGGMRERVGAVGGALAAGPGAHGWAVRAVVPDGTAENGRGDRG